MCHRRPLPPGQHFLDCPRWGDDGTAAECTCEARLAARLDLPHPATTADPLELARGLLDATLHGPPPIESTMALASAVVELHAELVEARIERVERELARGLQWLRRNDDDGRLVVRRGVIPAGQSVYDEQGELVGRTTADARYVAIDLGPIEGWES